MLNENVLMFASRVRDSGNVDSFVVPETISFDEVVKILSSRGFSTVAQWYRARKRSTMSPLSNGHPPVTLPKY